MTNSLKMPAIRRPGFFARIRSWLGRLLRRKQSPKLPNKTVEKEETVPFFVLPVVSKRVVMAENPLLAPIRPRLRPPLVTTPEQPVTSKEEIEQTTKVHTPPEPIPPPLPVSVISPRGKARLLSILEGPTVETPMEVVSRDAATQKFHSPHLVSPTTGSKIIPPILRNPANEQVPVRSVASVLSYEEAPKTLVQARVQDDPELMELVEEFNAKNGDSEP